MPWLVPAVMAVAGGIAGAEKDNVDSKSSSGINMAPETDLERYGGKLTNDSLKSLEGYVNAGPGESSITDANKQYGSLADMLSEYAKNGGQPNQQDWFSAQDFAKSQFAPQQLQIDQSFDEEQMRAKQLATQLGRSVNDPYIQAQLSKQKMQMQNMLGAQQGAFIGQEARNNSMGRLGYTSQLADLKGSLASQAMANRQALLSLGTGVQAQERNWRYQTGTKWGTNHQESGGGQKGMITGAMAGFGSGMSMMGSMGGKPTTAPTGSTPQSTGMLGVNTDLGYGGGMQQSFGQTQYFGQMGAQTPQMPQRGSRFAAAPQSPFNMGRQVPY